jgi:hypothetical protein
MAIPAGDTLTFLRCSDGHVATKTIRPDGVVDFSAGMWFAVAVVPVDGVRELGAVLTEATSASDCFLVRGEPLPDTDPERTRRLGPKNKTPRFHENGGRRWLWLDFDKAQLSRAVDLATEPAEAARLLVVEHLPREFHGVTCWWQLSSSAGLSGTITNRPRMHIAFWLDRLVTDAEIKKWAKHLPIDRALYNPVQPHFTAAPIFDGVADPLPVRCGLLEGARDEVTFPYESRLAERLARMGDDGDGFHDSLLRSSFEYYRSGGRDDEALKELLRSTIAGAFKAEGRDVSRYESDAYLDQLLEGGKQKLGLGIGDTIQLGEDVHRVVNEAIGALAEKDHNLYQRNGRLVRILHAEADELVAVGTPQIGEISAATLVERLTAAAHFERWDDRLKGGGGWKRVVPPDRVVKAVAERGDYRGVRPLSGLAETPTLRPDGSLVFLPGYDPATGYYLTMAGGRYAVDDAPGLEAARDALWTLRYVWSEFPFKTEAERAVAYAAVMTVVGRAAFENVPLFAFDAARRKQGKTLCAEAVSLIATGRVVFKASWPTSDEELEKVLAAHARRGTALIGFDNVPVGRAVKGDALDRCLTCSGAVSLRVLGASRIEEHAWTATMLVGGNQLAIGGDTVRRACLARLAAESNGTAKEYREPQLMAYCRRERPRLVAAALTLMRAYALAGCPDQKLGRRSMFDRWVELVAGSIAWASGVNVLEAWPEGGETEDDGLDALLVLLRWWGETFPAGATVRQALDALEDKAPAGVVRKLEVMAAVKELLGLRGVDKVEAKLLGGCLRDKREWWIEGMCFDRKRDEKRGAKWFVRNQ